MGFIGQIVPDAASGGVSPSVGDYVELFAPNNNQVNNTIPYLFAGTNGGTGIITTAGSIITCDNSAGTTQRVVNIMFSVYGTSAAGTDEFSLQVANGVGPNAATDTHVATASPYMFQLNATYNVAAGAIATFQVRLTCGGANFVVSANAANYFWAMCVQ